MNDTTYDERINVTCVWRARLFHVPAPVKRRAGHAVHAIAVDSKHRMVYDSLPASGQASAYAGAHPSYPGAQSEEDAFAAAARTRNASTQQYDSPKDKGDLHEDIDDRKRQAGQRRG
jgi:hypothetical protein